MPTRVDAARARLAPRRATRGRPVGHDMPMTDGGTDPDSTSSPADDAVAPPAVTKPEIPFGEWPSPISAADVARGGLRLSFPTVVGADVWSQSAPRVGGRRAAVFS